MQRVMLCESVKVEMLRVEEVVRGGKAIRGNVRGRTAFFASDGYFLIVYFRFVVALTVLAVAGDLALVGKILNNEFHDLADLRSGHEISAAV